MRVFKEINEQKKLSLALGFFDGLHPGHVDVIKNAVKVAQNNSQKSAVITFFDHPKCFFNSEEPKYILTREQRREKIAALGVDYMYELDFGKYARLNANDYLEQVLIKFFSPIAITTGFNHSFGQNKSGGTDLLDEMSCKYGYKYYLIPAKCVSDEIISSTKIREYLSSGQIENANNMLGYNFSISGEIVYGQQLGRQIGFKTANIESPAELIILPFGVYRTKVVLGGSTYYGVTNYGIRPTVSNENHLSIETHILDFEDDIYGQTISVEFLSKIRNEIKFSSLSELKAQIHQDVLFVKNYK